MTTLCPPPARPRPPSRAHCRRVTPPSDQWYCGSRRTGPRHAYFRLRVTPATSRPERAELGLLVGEHTHSTLHKSCLLVHKLLIRAKRNPGTEEGSLCTSRYNFAMWKGSQRWLRGGPSLSQNRTSLLIGRRSRESRLPIQNGRGTRLRRIPTENSNSDGCRRRRGLSDAPKV